MATIRSKSPAALDALLVEQRTLLANLRFQWSAGGRTDVRALRAIRQTIARILTVRCAQRSGRVAGDAHERLTPSTVP